jgi:hypothetical protein
MFFDRDEEIRGTLREALRQRGPASLRSRRYAWSLIVCLRIKALSSNFLLGVGASSRRSRAAKPLKARARAIRDEIAQIVSAALAECLGREPNDPIAHLASGLLLATWTVALIQAHRTFRKSRDTEKAKAAFLAIVDKGTIGIKAAVTRTPYA